MTDAALAGAQALWADERRRTREVAQAEIGRAEIVHSIDVEIPFGDPTLASDIGAGEQRDVTIPFDWQLARWRLLPVGSATFSVAVSRATYAAYPAFTAIGTASMGTAAVAKAEDAALAGWTTAGSADDVLRFVAGTPSTGLKYATLILRLRRATRPTLTSYSAAPE